MHKSTHLIFTVPWGPHCGLVSVFNARPRSIQGLVQCLPRALPMEEFKVVFEQMEPVVFNRVYAQARERASSMLLKQKLKTGVAILGKPSQTLEDDPKYQGGLLEAQISNGEQLALAALSAEIAIVNVLNIPLANLSFLIAPIC